MTCNWFPVQVSLSFSRANPHYPTSGSSSSGDYTVKFASIRHKALLFSCLAVLLSACASTPKVTTIQHLSPEADAPYEKFLVIVLLDSFDSRKYLEKEIVLQLAERGTDAVASTTMMDSRTPATRQTFIDMVDKIGADAVTITQLKSAELNATVKDMRPRATYNIRPTYYYNVWSVDLTEYVAPQGIEYEAQLALATQVLSVAKTDTVWSIESNVTLVRKVEHYWEYSIYVDQAIAIARNMTSAGLIAK